VLKKLNSEFYPSNFILKRSLELNIPVCLSSDAHQVHHVMALLPEASELLKSLGYKKIYILDEETWVPVSII
jgi:histidinol-phosphatase (PHP family)